MSRLFNETMTVYNYLDGEWHRTVVEHIQWRHAKNDTVIRNGVLTSTVGESITIDCSGSRNSNYVIPVEYTQNCEGKWTLDAKNKKDAVVLGRCSKEITDDYQISQLLKDYAGNSGIVTEVKDSRNRRHLPVIKVVAQ